MSAFRFIVTGDSRGKDFGINEMTFRRILENIKGLEKQPDFILFLGDMVNGEDNLEDELREWRDIAREYYPVTMYYPSIGNHENNEAIFNKVFNYLPNRQLRGYGRTVYAFDYFNSRFIILNSIRKNRNGNYVIDNVQLMWLEGLLKDNTITHKFVAFHVPAFPTGHHYGGSLDSDIAARNRLWAIINKYKTTAVFSGHEHNYSRRIIDSSFSSYGYNFRNKVYQIISGGAGAPLSGRRKDVKNVIIGPIPEYHYIVVDVENNKINFNSYDLNGKVIDHFSIIK